jgi:hypothetical protein
MTKELQEKKWLEFQTWIKADSFQVYKEYLLKIKERYEEDIKKMLRRDDCDLGRLRVARALADNIDLVLTTHIKDIMHELKPPDQTDDVQIY